MRVKGVLDGQHANQRWAAAHGLVGRLGIQPRPVASSKTVIKMHHKPMVVDGHVTIAGSSDYTGPANKLTDANISWCFPEGLRSRPERGWHLPGSSGIGGYSHPRTDRGLVKGGGARPGSGGHPGALQRRCQLG